MCTPMCLCVCVYVCVSVCVHTCAQEQASAPAPRCTDLPSHLLPVLLGRPWATTSGFAGCSVKTLPVGGATRQERGGQWTHLFHQACLAAEKPRTHWVWAHRVGTPPGGVSENTLCSSGSFCTSSQSFRATSSADSQAPGTSFSPAMQIWGKNSREQELTVFLRLCDHLSHRVCPLGLSQKASY